jgi:uncharacterized protein DUF4124
MFAKHPLPGLPFAAGVLATFLAWPAGAEVYKWVDENGVVNYGSTPPAGRPVKELPKDGSGVSVVPAPPPPPPAAARNPTEERIDRLERALAAERAARDAQEREAEDQRLAAIARCEANRGVDCDQNPYQNDGGYGVFVPAGRPFVRHHFGMTPVPKPLPAFDHKPPPRPARTGPAASHPRLPTE